MIKRNEMRWWDCERALRGALTNIRAGLAKGILLMYYICIEATQEPRSPTILYPLMHLPSVYVLSLCVCTILYCALFALQELTQS